MATCSSILAWRTPWTAEPGGLQSGMRGGLRVGHDPVSKHSTHTTHQNGTGCAAAEPAHITRELWATVFLHSILLVSKGVILHF